MTYILSTLLFTRLCHLKGSHTYMQLGFFIINEFFYQLDDEVYK